MEPALLSEEEIVIPTLVVSWERKNRRDLVSAGFIIEGDLKDSAIGIGPCAQTSASLPSHRDDRGSGSSRSQAIGGYSGGDRGRSH
ncbi:hypothetical protein C5167_009909, partial [Papaver somniferum]